ncbi:MAG: ATP-dependent DNA helicase [Bacillota bacterium]
MVYCSCGEILVFKGTKKTHEYEFECNRCGKNVWRKESDISPEEKREIEEFIRNWRKNRSTTAQSNVVAMKPSSIPVLQKPTSSYTSLYHEPAAIPVPQDMKLIKLKNIFENVLPKKKAGYSLRPAQVDLAEEFLKTLRKGGVIISEAGVGTGKTYAYCIPILLTSFYGPVIISTKTISLQEQLKDDLCELIGLMGVAYKAPVLVTKGANNYVCLEKLDDERKKLPPKTVEVLNNWVKTTDYGDLGEIQEKIEPETLNKIRATDCYPKCQQKRNCPYSNHKHARKQFNEGILICNHNMLAADTNMRAVEDAGLWPKPAAIVIDEAHGLEQAFRDTMGRSFSSSNFNKVRKQILSAGPGRTLDIEIEAMKSAVDTLFETVYQVSKTAAKDDNNRFLIPVDENLIISCILLLETLEKLNEKIDIMSYAFQDRYGTTRVNTRLERASKKLRENIRALRAFTDSPSKYYASGELEEGTPELFLGPVEIDQFLSDTLWRKRSSIPVILTSGTLTDDDGSFSLVKQRLGLNFTEKFNEKVGAIKLELNGKIGLYIGSDLPEPQDDDEHSERRFRTAVAERIYQLIQMSRGRALVLFTSHERMDYVSWYLKKQALSFPVYKQGDFAHGVLTEKFRREMNSTLLATGAFWEGIDVVGPSLSLLILDKLPFPSPGDPLTKVRRERLEKQGLDSFENLALPEMLLRLRQGSGRLIRHENDTGIIALLDSRIKKRPYKQKIFKALPQAPELTLTGVKDFFNADRAVIHQPVS